MDFWKELRARCAFFFTLPVLPTLDDLLDCKEYFTFLRVRYGVFWFVVVALMILSGVWEHMMVDVKTCYEWLVWLAFVFVDWENRILSYWELLPVGVRFNFYFNIIPFALISVLIHWCFRPFFRQAFKVVSVFIRELGVQLFYFKTHGNDGYIMIIEGVEELEKVVTTKAKTKVFGVPKAVKIKQQQAIESAQAKIPNGSVEKAPPLSRFQMDRLESLQRRARRNRYRKHTSHSACSF